MQLDVQWFVSALLNNNLITTEDAKAINRELGGEPDLMTFAQEFLNRITSGLSEEDAQAWMTQIQQVLDYAASQAQAGTPPPEAAQLADDGGGYVISGAANALGAHAAKLPEDLLHLFL